MTSNMKTFKAISPRTSSERRRSRASKSLIAPLVELLENRQLLATAIMGPTNIPAPYWTPTDSNLFDAQNGPMANLGPEIVSIYQSYATGIAASNASGNSASAAVSASVADGLAAQFPTIQFQNGLVGMDIKSLGGISTSS
jgi:large repetitive protein